MEGYFTAGSEFPASRSGFSVIGVISSDLFVSKRLMLSILTVYSFIDLDIVACYKALLARYHVNVRFLRLSGIFYITHLFLQEFVNHVVVRNGKR